MNDELSAGNSTGPYTGENQGPQQSKDELYPATPAALAEDEKVAAGGPIPLIVPRVEEAPAPVVPRERTDAIERLLESICSRLQLVEERLTAVQAQIEVLVKQHEIAQGGLRQLGSKVSDAATSLGAPRVRETFMRVLMLYDLIEPAPAHLSPESSDLCRLLSEQIEQFLAVQGIERIQTDGLRFDPTLHKPVKIVSIDDPAKEATVLNTLRNGFRSEFGVLRPAEVTMGRCPPKCSPGNKGDTARLASIE